jgi:membrane protein implicated in regulation of membrane protease activity
MANSDSERGARDEGRGPTPSERTWDGLYVFLLLAIVVLIVLDVGAPYAGALGGGSQYYLVATVSVILTVLDAYFLLHFRKRRKPAGRDFNL